MEAVVTAVEATSETIILIPEQVNRMNAGIWNGADKVLVLKYGFGCAPDSFTMKVAPGQFFNMADKYTGTITGYWEDGAVGTSMVSELYARHELAVEADNESDGVS